MLGRSLRILAVLTVCAVVLVAWAQRRPGASKIGVGKQAPEFKAKTLSGKEINFPSDYKGKVVLIDFWATWCGPCRAEVPHLVRVYDKYHEQGLEILGVTADGPRISEEKVRKFLKQYKMTWEQVYEEVQPIAVKYGVRGIPAPFLVDGDTGKILAVPADLRGKKLKKSIKKHVEAKARQKKDAEGEKSPAEPEGGE